MKKLLKLFVLPGILLLFIGNVYAFPISAGDTVKMDNDQVNPYTMDLLDSSGNSIEKFNAFCVELGFYFTSGNSYTVDSVTDYATGGGSGGATNGKDYISDESKWLYASYFDGVFGSLNNNLALKVQQAIWFMEEEGTGEVYQTAWNDLSGQTTDFSISGWDIRVVNLTDADGNDKQSQLVGNEVPEPATMLLFGAGLAGLIGIYRRKK